MPDYRRRKPLRERVALRKAGHTDDIDDPGSRKNRLWRVWMSWIGVLLQAAATLLLLGEIVFLMESGFQGVSYTRLALYLLVFLFGRLIQVALAMTRPR